MERRHYAQGVIPTPNLWRQLFRQVSIFAITATRDNAP